MSSDKTPLEAMLQITANYLAKGDIAQAADTARRVSPYVAMTAEQIIGALEAGISTEEFMRHRKTLLRKVGIESVSE